jgi:predicted metal-dependent enzyme (double-stranded beta helix superfamily)
MTLADTLAAARISPLELGRLVSSIAERPERWRDIVRFDAGERWYQRLELTDDLEVWLLSWLPGQGTGFHDHGEAMGAFTVAQGELTERTVPARQARARNRPYRAGQVRPFGRAHVHDVVNLSAGPAVSVHAYSPPLTAMRRYELTGTGLVHTGTDQAELGW